MAILVDKLREKADYLNPRLEILYSGVHALLLELQRYFRSYLGAFRHSLEMEDILVDCVRISSKKRLRNLKISFHSLVNIMNLLPVQTLVNI